MPSWASASLEALGYNSNPAKIQLLIRKIFEEATRYVSDYAFFHHHLLFSYKTQSFSCFLVKSSIQIPGSEVIPVPLFIPLDGTRTEDYVARVEPSAMGGRKMAEYMLDTIHSSGNCHSQLGMSAVASPKTSFIDRSAT